MSRIVLAWLKSLTGSRLPNFRLCLQPAVLAERFCGGLYLPPLVYYYCVQFRAGDAYELFATMLTQRPWEDVMQQDSGLDRLTIKYTPEDRERLMKGAAENSHQISALLLNMPRALLLLLKTNDCLR